MIMLWVQENHDVGVTPASVEMCCILPKIVVIFEFHLQKHAESCLPYLEFRDGVNLAIEDFTSPKIWSMRYR